MTVLAICIVALAVVCLGLVAGLGHLARRLDRVEAFAAQVSSANARLSLRVDEHKRSIDSAGRLIARQAQTADAFHERLIVVEARQLN